MKTASVTIQRASDDRVWVGLAFSLRLADYREGEHYVAYSDGFRCHITPLDEEAARAFEEDDAELAAEASAAGDPYLCAWGAYVMEGAHHGFRKMGTTDRGVVLHKLEGCLGLDGDVAGIISAATLGVVLLLGGEASQVETSGWRPTKCSID